MSMDFDDVEKDNFLSIVDLSKLQNATVEVVESVVDFYNI